MVTTAHRLRAMGSDVDIAIHGDPKLAESAVARIHDLEQRWSRFLPDSEISRCNATRGLPVFVSADTRRLVRHGVRAWQRTRGACDPTVLDALVAAGYDRPYDRLDPHSTPATARPVAAPGCGGIDIDDDLGAVTLPEGTGFDPGAIGKGLAADMVAEELIDAGAYGAFVSVGGDLRVVGHPEHGDGWAIQILEPAVASTSFGTIALREGAVATSTDRKRCWRRGGSRHHHVIDPATGLPSCGEAALVTTVTGAGWWAEALATQLMLTPRAGWADVVGPGDAALVVDTAGVVHRFGRMREYLR